LIAHGNPFHLSAYEYISEFLELDGFNGQGDSRLGHICIDLSENRGHLIDSEQGVEFHCGTTDALSVVGSINRIPVNLDNPKDSFVYPAGEMSDVELWLVAHTNEIIDYRSSSEWTYRYATQGGHTKQEKLLGIITEGESERCEFKKYIDLSASKNLKARELAVAVCAFSNHQGGLLFIGVDDDTVILGINNGCERDYKCAVRDSVLAYESELRKRLSESLSQNQCFSTHVLEHRGLFVLMIDVKISKGINYLLEKNEAYIRRGASSARMSPPEIQVFSSSNYIDGSGGHTSYYLNNEDPLIG
jgi:hypothetical protein